MVFFLVSYFSQAIVSAHRVVVLSYDICEFGFYIMDATGDGHHGCSVHRN